MTTYRVIQGDQIVHEVTTPEYEGLEPFGQWRGRPAAGAPPFEMWIDEELIGIQEPLDVAFEAEHLVRQMEAGMIAAGETFPSQEG